MTQARFFLPSLLACLYCFVALPTYGLEMKGKVYDAETGSPISHVVILNTFTQQYVESDSMGYFMLAVEKGHLIEFQKLGYKIARVRIETNELPYYSIAMRKGAIELAPVEVKGHHFRTDSIEAREVYQWAIDHYKLEGLEILEHPFDALSKRNRRIWAFQKRFQYFERQKFIDYVFNDQLIHEITGIDTPQLHYYKVAYRPSYDQIQAWSTYEFYEYIKKTGVLFKQRTTTEQVDRPQGG